MLILPIPIYSDSKFGLLSFIVKVHVHNVNYDSYSQIKAELNEHLSYFVLIRRNIYIQHMQTLKLNLGKQWLAHKVH